MEDAMMRCRRATRWMVTALDGELPARRRRALDGHVARCPACRHEMATTAAVLQGVGGLATSSEVPGRLEQATFRRVRLLAAAEAERAATRAWWMRLRLPALGFATAVVATVAVGLMRGSGDRPLAPRPGDGGRRVVAQAPTKDKPPLVASRERGGPQATATVPAEPPPELAAAPELFVDLPLLRNMEKLEHFETIRTTTLDDGEEQSNG